jgi:hypothetical protein
MTEQSKWRRFIEHPVTQWSMFALGLLLLIAAPLVGVLPGPGGILVAAAGLALILRTSMWAKRRYVKFKRWQPKVAHWTDRALRRRSARRRDAVKRAPARTAEN